MNRRDFLALLGALPAFLSVAARSQPGSSVPHIGILDTGSAGGFGDKQYWSAFRDEIEKLGYIDGQTIVLEFRWAERDPARLSALAAELAKLSVRVVVAASTPCIIAAKSVGANIPIVSPRMADPLGSGFAKSLARPGGNITGMTTLSSFLSAKRLELLKGSKPGLSRAGMVWDQNIPSFALTAKQSEAAAKTLGISLEIRAVKAEEELEAALSEFHSAGCEGVIFAIPTDSVIGGGDPARLIGLVARHRLPAVYAQSEFVQAGGFLSYGPDNADLFRRTAHLVDKILKGANPGELPIEQPTKFELVINLKAAKVLGLTIPPSLLARADEVIE